MLRLVLREGMSMTLTGVAIGLAAALGLESRDGRLCLWQGPIYRSPDFCRGSAAADAGGARGVLHSGTSRNVM